MTDYRDACMKGYGDDSATTFGPNATWGANLAVGAIGGTDKANATTAQVVVTNGNLHLDGANGYTIYYGYYANYRGTPIPHWFWGQDIRFQSGLIQQTDTYAQPVVICNNRLCVSQSQQRCIQMANGLAWGGGSNYTYAFYKYNTLVPAKISGKLSYYVGSAGWAYPYMRIYSQRSGI